jgi:pyruvate formate lyase activating enzyme
MDAANVDLKGFTEHFYAKTCSGHLEPVLDTLKHLRHETDVWFEITNLLIPGLNDSDQELERMTTWVVDELGPDVPMHFTAFHPDYKMRDRPPTPPETLSRARSIALRDGVRFAYTGNVHDRDGGSTYCAECGACMIATGMPLAAMRSPTRDAARPAAARYQVSSPLALVAGGAAGCPCG